MSKVIPNKLQLAQQELPTNQLGNFIIPTEIDAKAAKNHYWLICVKATDSADKMNKVFSYKKRVISIKQYNRIERQVNEGIFKQMFGAVFNKVVILHNPTLPFEKVEDKKEEKKKVKALSNIAKGKANGLKEKGLSNEEIAKELEVELERVDGHFA